MIQVTQENYYSHECDGYLSNSQLKHWQRCPRGAYARYVEHDQRTQEPPRKAFAEGSLLDALLLDPSDLPRVEEEHKSFLFNSPPKPTKANPEPEAPRSALYRDVEAVAEQIKGMQWVMDVIGPCKKQDILTPTIEDVPFKCRFDLVNHDTKFIWDMKFMASLSETIWDNDLRRRTHWIEAYRYKQQLAVYREAQRQAVGVDYNVGILAIQKPTPSAPTPAVRCYFWDSRNRDQIDAELQAVKQVTRTVDAWRNCDPVDLARCEDCEYCRQTAEPWFELYMEV